jgi:hypothetical protein
MGCGTKFIGAILYYQKIEKRNQVILVRDQRVARIPFFKLEIIEVRLDNWMGLHKKRIAAK